MEEPKTDEVQTVNEPSLTPNVPLESTGEVIEAIKDEYVICPKCGEMITWEYFAFNKQVKAEEKVETPVVEEKAEGTIIEPPVETQAEKKQFTGRSEETGDKVFLVDLDKKRRYWVKNPETLVKLGFNLGSERNLPFNELISYVEGNPVDLTIPGSTFPREEKLDIPQPLDPEEAKKPSAIWS
ncbi:MAG: hypothetical protein WC549_00515 [Actinomycetota bacterium]